MKLAWINLPLLAAVAAFVLGSWLGWVFLGLHLGVVVTGIVCMPSGIWGRAHVCGAAAGCVALTYDDGPDPEVTGALLDLLKERGARATFFVIGKNVRAHPELVRRCHAEGHEVANHSDRHSKLTNFYFSGRMRREMQACQDSVEQVTGKTPRYYRPPVGLMNHSAFGAARALGMELAAWSVRSFDRSNTPAERVAARVLKHVGPGGIALLHDGGVAKGRVLEITRRILDGLEERGLRAVRLDRLLAKP